jgi:hypothetical protein
MRFPRPGARRLPASATAVGGAAFALALAVSTPAGADQPPFRTPVGAIPLSAEEFRAFAEGWTLHFERDGAPFGTESFGHGGRTLWRPEGGSCTPGFWAAVGSEVCFFYARRRTAAWRCGSAAGTAPLSRAARSF